MIEIEADIVLGEAFRPAAIAHSHVYRGGVRRILLPALALAGAIILSSMVGMLLPLLSLRLEGLASLLWIGGGILGLMLALRILSSEHMRGFLDGLRRIGSPDVFPTRFRFDEQGMSIASSRISYLVPWASILFIVPSPEHWLVQVDTMTLVIPYRAFPDPQSERAFLDLVGARLLPDAKRRSVLDRKAA
ncbi:MAG TPA: YcxB family protein [Sphingomicrobium sp.]|nr:YcxB family protein [Sphingomicrobium sp.]